jgi:Ca-activated chloride channel family protein
MPTGRSPGVRSHRRVVPRRRRLLPWLVVPLALALIGSGLTIGYVYLKKTGCSGQATANIVAAPRTAALLRTLATQWEQTKPSVNGTCAAVTIREQDTAVTAQALTRQWDPASEGPAPDVWVPPSSAWARAAAAQSDIADKLMPDRLPSVARTPVVIAMPKQLAETYGWPNSDLDWKDLLDKLAADGNVKIGMSDPATSTAGLLALSSIIDANDDNDVDPDELKRVFALQQKVAVYKPNTEDLFAEYVSSQGKTISAFPALEQDVVKHNDANPSLPLVAVYPKNNTTEADNPFLALRTASWTDAKRQDAAQSFLDFVKGEKGRNAVLAEGFRDSNRVAGPLLTPAKGVVTKLTALPRTVLLADAITKTVYYWNALTRPANVLLAVDVSGSMKVVIPGTGQTRFELLKSAVTEAIGMFSASSQVGLWAFEAQQGGQSYREVVKQGRLDEVVAGVDRRKKLTDEVAKLTANGDTPLYNTIWGGYQQLQTTYMSNTENLLVVLTDGDNDWPRGGLQLQELLDKIKAADPSKPVKVVTIGVGRDTNNDALNQISAATGVRSYSADRSFDISKVLLAAIFSLK